MLWDILSWLAIGLIVGFIASKIMGSKGGFWRNVIIGIIGSLLGGWLASLIGLSTGSFIVSVLVAIGGACLLIWLVRIISKK